MNIKKQLFISLISICSFGLFCDDCDIGNEVQKASCTEKRECKNICVDHDNDPATLCVYRDSCQPNPDALGCETVVYSDGKTGCGSCNPNPALSISASVQTTGTCTVHHTHIGPTIETPGCWFTWFWGTRDCLFLV